MATITIVSYIPCRVENSFLHSCIKIKGEEGNVVKKVKNLPSE